MADGIVTSLVEIKSCLCPGCGTRIVLFCEDPDSSDVLQIRKQGQFIDSISHGVNLAEAHPYDLFPGGIFKDGAERTITCYCETEYTIPVPD